MRLCPTVIVWSLYIELAGGRRGGCFITSHHRLFKHPDSFSSGEKSSKRGRFCCLLSSPYSCFSVAALLTSMALTGPGLALPPLTISPSLSSWASCCCYSVLGFSHCYGDALARGHARKVKGYRRALPAAEQNLRRWIRKQKPLSVVEQSWGVVSSPECFEALLRLLGADSDAQIRFRVMFPSTGSVSAGLCHCVCVCSCAECTVMLLWSY